MGYLWDSSHFYTAKSATPTTNSEPKTVYYGRVLKRTAAWPGLAAVRHVAK